MHNDEKTKVRVVIIAVVTGCYLPAAGSHYGILVRFKRVNVFSTISWGFVRLTRIPRWVSITSLGFVLGRLQVNVFVSYSMGFLFAQQ